MTEWYYENNGEERGPLTEAQIKAILDSGIITPDTLVWQAGATGKQKASEFIFCASETFAEIPFDKIERIAKRSKFFGWAALLTPVISIFLGELCFFIGLLFSFIAGCIALFSGIYSIILMFRHKYTSGRSASVTGIILSIIAFGILFILPAIRCYTPYSPRIACANNLKQIGLALREYAVDNDDFFPPYDGAAGLELLRKNDYLVDYGIYICPSSNLKPPKPGMPLTEDTVSYVYKGGQSERVTTPVAWDKDGNHKDYGNIVYTDGHVDSARGANWQEKLNSK